MSPLQFLTTVWPATGLYCIAEPLPGRKAFKHRVFKTIAAAARYVDKLGKTSNVYFATHTLNDYRIWNKKHHRDPVTKKWVGNMSTRTQENMVFSRVLFLDLDVNANDEDKYASQKEAIIALKAFCVATGLPKPMLTSSGLGVHVFWLLEEPAGSHDVWLTMARRLRQLAEYYKIKFDPMRTLDQSSVLRVAGTWNVKRKAEVKVLADGVVTPTEEFGRILVGALEDINVNPSPEKRAKDALDALGSNVEAVYDKPLSNPKAMDVFKACAQMHRIALTKGNVPEPQWYAGCIGVMKFTEKGNAAVHQISSGHPTYSFAETEEKIERWGDAPSTCANLERKSGHKHAALCKSCKYYSHNKSPIYAARLEATAPPPVVTVSFGDTTVEATVNIPNPPTPYRRTENDGVQMGLKRKDESVYFVPLYPYDLYPIMRNTNTERETEQQSWRVHLPEGIKDFTVEASVFTDNRSLETRLANIGVYHSKFPELKGYMSAYIQELQRLNPITQQVNHLGWTDDGKGFVLSTKMFVANEKPQQVSLSKMAAEAKSYIKTKGTLEKQIELMHFFDDPKYAPVQFYILEALGSILFRLTGHNGVIVHMTGETSAGKSTALQVAGSLFGPPLQYVVNCTEQGATPLYRANRLEVLSNLPLCLDEMTHIADEVAKDFTMNATQAIGRRGMKPDGTPREAHETERSSITLSTGNRSLQDILAVDNAAGAATSVRVFEIHLKEVHLHEGWQAEEMLSGLKENYGHIAEQFINFVVDHAEELAKQVPEAMKKVNIAANMRREERFWRAGIACAIVAAKICQKLGLLSWGTKPIMDWLRSEQLPTLRGTIQEEMQGKSALATLMSYIEYIHADMIKVKKGTGGNLDTPETLPRGEMKAHFDIDNRVLYVGKDPFRSWCQRRGQYSQAILKELSTSGVVPAISVLRTMGGGTTHAKGRSWVFIVDMKHKDIAERTLKLVSPVSAIGGPPKKAKP